ncbi:CBS domain-containing protein [Pseudooceanicola sediminis]|uniref:CBS domain-containing protein n=1 Tax=Pseudooceanicola sediminis TaxID=2211117 RepID=A0A399J317_9RHOB|nr:CBS domain-containing protein [Pseudooceanicola sediminis]KAA2317361.1 CBS domain-containing protein [Puniceibacterium sp. HSS470]RII39714.1 CBS domain-containing protein [Pseudooceanicola sediminis]|tara:strand:- start:4717 stop:5151 length:435 start_codon:yes stop_codon:yes gene_type:complete
MLVQQILKGKSTEGVFTVSPDTPVHEVARLLAEKRIGGLVVSTDGKHAEGILSERDIVRALAARGASCLEMATSALMTKDPICCTLDMMSDEVLRKMTEGRFRHMPVTKDGELVGIVTIGDVVKARLTQLSAEKDALEGMIMGH